MADQGHGGIVFNFSALQTIVHPHFPHAVRPFTSPLSTVLSATDDFHLIVAFIAASQYHIYGFHRVAHAERTILRRGGRPGALKYVQSSATMSSLVGGVNVVICPTTSYATSSVARASADCHPAKGVFDGIDQTYGGAPGKAVDVPPRQCRTKDVPDTTGRRRAERQEVPKEATIILVSPPAKIVLSDHVCPVFVMLYYYAFAFNMPRWRKDVRVVEEDVIVLPLSS